MIIVSIITLIISFLLQGIISNYLGYSLNSLSWFLTIYPLINILILTPHFENTSKNITIIIITGLLIDIVYTNTFMLNACLFVLIYYFSKIFHFLFPYNLLTINISNLLGVETYHIVTFLFLSLIRYDKFSFKILLKVLSHNIIMTLIYTSIMYIIIETIVKKFELKEIK